MSHKLHMAPQGDREILMTRDFDAPRGLVFEAWTKPELLKRWLGVFNGWELAVCEIDLRVGGALRYVWRRDRTDMGMSGLFREVVPPERLVSTEQFDSPWYPGEAVGVVTFVERGGKTTMTQTMTYASQEARDGVLKSGMETGLVASFDKLAQVLSSQMKA
jgi:uncharacterized protein YndB with AHSA1/START domain